MSATTHWDPYETPAQLAKGRRTTILSLLGGLAAVGTAIRWSRTPDFGADT